VRQQLFASVDEAVALDGLRHKTINYDPARAPEDGRADGHWHVDSGDTVIGREPPGPPVPGGAWETGCTLVRQYEFAEPRILRGVYRAGGELKGRDMLLEGRFAVLRFYLGVRVTGIIDETTDTERVWGWSYQTLEGHLEQGRLTYEVIKDTDTGRVRFRVRGYSRMAPIPSPIVRLGFRLFGRWTQQRFYLHVQRRMRGLVQAAGRGAPLPKPAVRPDGLVLAPSGTAPHPLEHLARSWLHPGR
jgi:uncharacterized protein (UPF0548 family)